MKKNFAILMLSALAAVSSYARVPAIFNFSPASGSIGTVVAISGTNFSATAASNIVYFGAVRANILVASPASLSVTVPAGATYAPITVTVNGMTAWANAAFMPTFNTGASNTLALAPRLDLPADNAPGQALFADVDGDGKPDLIVNSGSPSQFLSIYRNISTNGAIIGAASFAPRVDIPVPGPIENGVFADLDGDGKLDFVVLDQTLGQVHILKNFSTPGNITSNSLVLEASLSTGNSPRGIVVRDLDGDGLPDIAVANFGDSTVMVFHNLGTTNGITTNSFATPVVFNLPAGTQPQDLKAADLDGDGKPDLATANNNYGTTNSVTLLLNTSSPGNISFATPIPIAGDATAYCLAIGDLDGDGKPDLVVSSFDYGQAVSVYRNLSSPGRLSFAPNVDFGLPGWGNGVAISDLNGDGKPDLAVVTQLGDSLTIFLNTSTPGSFTANSLAASVSYPTGWNPNGVAIGDIDGDGRPDIAFAVSYASTVSVYQNLTAPATNTPAVNPPVITGLVPPAGTNGETILISGNYFNPASTSNIVRFGAVLASVLSASPTSLTVAVPVGATFGPVTVTVGGLTAYSSHPFQPTYPGGSTNITSSSFAPEFTLPAGDGPAGTAIGDLDGDGKPDLVLINIYDDTVWIYRNISTDGSLSAGSFAAPVILTMAGNLNSLALADLDGDGRLDIVVTDQQNNNVSVLRNLCSPGVITSNSFAPRVDFPVGQQPHGVAVMDLNGDGRPDIVTGNNVDNTISVLQNTGAPGGITSSSFAAHVDIPTGAGPEQVAVGDLDGDGIPDIVTANLGAGTFSVFRNLGIPGVITTNSFAPRLDLMGDGGGGEDVVIADVDGDGKPDLLVSGYLPQVLSVFLNTSTPGSLTTNSFAPRVDFPTGGRTHRVALADLEGDGMLDVVVTTELPDQLLVFKNLSSPGVLTTSSLAAPALFSTGSNPNIVSIGDLDGDGRPDIFFLNAYSNDAMIYQNLMPFGTPPVAPVITTQPTNLTVTASNTALFNVVATGTPPPGYQWSFDGTNIVGATSATLTLANVLPAQAGTYSVIVSNSAGSVPSSNAVLTVYVPPTPPTILSQTPSQVVAVGDTVTFSVTVFGSSPLSYFWSQNGALIPNATNSSYTLFNVPLSDTGSEFSCLVTNAYGSAASTNDLLKVINTVANGLCSDAIIITNASYTNTQSTLDADAPGNPVPDCVDGFGHGVWYQFTAPVAGLLYVDTFGSDYDTGLALYTGVCGSMTEVACNDDIDGLSTSQVSVPTTAGTTYYILAGGYDSDAGNLVLHLNYLTPPAFAVEPTNLSVVVSSNAIFSPTLTGSLPMGFQWYFNNTPLTDGNGISGSASSTLTIANVQTNEGGNYQLVASNIVGVTTSSVAVLTPVILPPYFVQLPVSQSVGTGSNVNFSAVMGGTPPFSYQWSLNGNPLVDDGVHVAGSATASLTISNLTTADAGSYALTVTNVSGSTNVTVALTVLTPPAIGLQPIGRSVPPGLPTIFTASTSGVPTPNYQWQLNGTNIPGATSASYTNAAVGTNTLGFYQLVVSNLMGVAVSTSAQLTFGPVAAWGRNLNNECLPPPGLSNVISVAGAYENSYAVRADGTIAAWGSSSPTNIPGNATNVIALTTDGNTGFAALRADGTIASWGVYSPSYVNNAVALSLGSYAGYALQADGTVVNWYNANYSVPAGLNHVTAIATGDADTLALRSDGTVIAWGSGPATNVPVGLANVRAIAAGPTYNLALITNGTVVAWGSGSGTNLPAGLTNITAISSSSYLQTTNLCVAIRANGAVVAWGNNPYGETNPPAALSNLLSVAIAAAPNHGLALVNNGGPQILRPPAGLTAYIGRNVTLQATVVGTTPLSYQWLLNGTNIPGATNNNFVLSKLQFTNAGNYQLFVSNSIATAISLPAPVNVISNNFVSFLTQSSVSSSNVYQGGTATFYGGAVLGNGPLSYQWFFSPTNKNYTAVSGATNDMLVLNPALAWQSGYYYLAVTNLFSSVTVSNVSSTGSTLLRLNVQFARAWGFDAISNPPVNVTNAIAVATGGYEDIDGQYLALGADGKVRAWANYFAFNGETNVSALSNSFVTAIAAGTEDSLALKSDGTVYAWGLGEYGETNPPTGLNEVVAIACGSYHDLAVTAEGNVVAWGGTGPINYGQATNDPAATNVVAVAAGAQHSLALRSDGTVVAWGDSLDGSTEVPLTATNIIAIAAGTSFSEALRANGTVVQWGNGISEYPIPANLSNVVAISASGTHVAALHNDGTVVSWGYDYSSLASNNVPPDVANVVAIASGGDHDFALLGTRAPAFTVQPWSRSIFNTTTSVWFSGKCAGVQPVSYQWQFNGTNLPGATNDMLTVNATVTGGQGPPKAVPLQSGVYQLIASNAYGVVASKYAQLTVLIPLGVALNATNLNWTTTGNAQWFGETNYSHDGVSAAQSGYIGPDQQTTLQATVSTNVAGTCTFWWMVSSELDFDFLQFSINGVAQAAISGSVGWQQVSIPVPAGTNVLTWTYSKESIYGSGLDAGWVDQFAFLPSPIINLQPTNFTAYAGTTAHFSVTATSSSELLLPLGYQWQKNGVNLLNSGNLIGGANTPTLVLSDVQDASAATYTVVITNNVGGSVTSSPAILTVIDSPPTITSQPVGTTNYAGTTSTFMLSVSGMTPMNYQWLINGADLAGRGVVSGTITVAPTNVILVLTNVQDADAAAYAAVIANADGSVTSSPAILTVVDGPPVITSQPANFTAFPGQTASFTVAAVGTLPLSYQWQFNRTNLNSATNLLLTIGNVGPSNAGPYQVVLTNAYGSATSSIATLTLGQSMVVAWGRNTFGQTNVPPGLANVVAIAGGYNHSLALQANGAVVAWGVNDEGQTNVPAGLTNAVAIAAGYDNNIVLQSNGTVVTWGYYSDGVLTAVPSGLASVTAVAAGWDHSMALTANGMVVAWGYNSEGETNVPANLTNVVAIAAGGYHSLALQANGTVVAWGDDSYGQSDVPAGLTNVVAIAAGGFSSLALLADGTVTAWGDDIDGQIDVPAGLTNVVAIAAGSDHSLALTANGVVVGWGLNSEGETNVPANLTNVVAIAAGGYHSLAIQNDGSPVIVMRPASQMVASNTTVQFTVTALGAPSLNYQWRKNGANLTDGGNVSGSATTSLTLSNVQTADMAVYSVVVSNSIDSATSSPAMLIVVGPPVILLQPAGQTANYGANVQFSVSALGNPPPAYLWLWNGTNQTGGNNSMLALTAVGRAQDGTYSVMVTNSAGGILSSNAVLEVLVPQLIGSPVVLPGGVLQITSADLGGGLLTPSDLPNFEAQASTNLVNWITLPNALSLTNGMLLLQDNTRTNYTTRYYRIIEH